MVTKIEHDGKLLALILRAGFSEAGITFFTPTNYSQQLGYMKHKSGHHIVPHIHNEIKRDVILTQETLLIKKGVLRVDFYDDSQHYLFSSILNAGDIILLSSGGHGFEIIEDIEMVEIKQGPYCGDSDKTRFDVSVPKNLIIKD